MSSRSATPSEFYNDFANYSGRKVFTSRLDKIKLNERIFQKNIPKIPEYMKDKSELTKKKIDYEEKF